MLLCVALELFEKVEGGLALVLEGIARGLVTWEELEVVRVEVVRGGAEGRDEGGGPDEDDVDDGGADMTFFAYDVREFILTFRPGFKLTWLTS